CPACRHAQSQGGTRDSCGVDFLKYGLVHLGRMQVEAARERAREQHRHERFRRLAPVPRTTGLSLFTYFRNRLRAPCPGHCRARADPDASVTIVASRFALHHGPEPAGVLAEMKRVCAPGGKVVVTDLEASPDPAKATAFNRMERLRDPSHVRALPLAELLALFSAVGLLTPRTTAYDLRSELEGLLGRSFPEPGNDVKVRQAIIDSVVDDALGIGAHRRGAEVHVAYPVRILVAER